MRTIGASIACVAVVGMFVYLSQCQLEKVRIISSQASSPTCNKPTCTPL